MSWTTSENSAMAFASFSASVKDIPGNGPYNFKVQSQIHRYISDLYPPNNQAPSACNYWQKQRTSRISPQNKTN